MDRERNHVLEDYWQEFSSFDDNPTEDDDDDASKTPDEGEAEEDWLREAGFQTLVDTEFTEDDQVEQCEDMFATLTPRQIAVVKKRLETVQRSKKRRHPVKQRAHVRDLFNNAAPAPSQVSGGVDDHPNRNDDQHKMMSSPAKSVDDVPPTEFRPIFKSAAASSERADWVSSSTRVVRPLPFLRTGHSGGFKLKDHTGSIDTESPTSVEVLRYESMISVAEDKDGLHLDNTEEPRERCHSEPASLETGFQEISSRLQAADETACI